MTRIALAALAATLLSVAALPARADDFDTCLNGEGQPAVDACTRLIESGNLSAGDMVHAYVNRGAAYDDLGQYESAIQDYDEAIREKPDDARAYYDRYLAERKMGNDAAADSDLAKAQAIDPDVGE